MRLKPGDLIKFDRTFTADDVSEFAEISGDRGRHHIEPDENGRVMVQGLLTATMLTKIGGDYNFLARRMTFEFLRPVFTSDTVSCDLRIESVSEWHEKTDVEASFICVNQKGKIVLKGGFSGLIP